MAETPPLPTPGAESCSDESPPGGEQPLGEPAGEAGQSEPGSPVAAPFFLLYPGHGGAGFGARLPPAPQQQQQRAWRTPPSPGSPLPFLLLSYPSGAGSGKHRESRWGDKGVRAPTSTPELRLPPSPPGEGRLGGGGRRGVALRDRSI